MVPEPCLSNTSICADSSSENLSIGSVSPKAVTHIVCKTYAKILPPKIMVHFREQRGGLKESLETLCTLNGNGGK